jgi:hypothetical protein
MGIYEVLMGIYGKYMETMVIYGKYMMFWKDTLW